ncbi:hypothetical protein J4E80_001965 [Alternaria sp. BMP 0032]|nr:hypothetical protein J4E80_001965 [Alternaria sp. BMP 0032]
MFQKFKGIRKGDTLRVPQFWSMVVKSHLIITCGPSALPELFDGSVEFISGDYLRTDGPSLVQVTDFYGQTTYLPLKLCSTYVALRRNIESKCLDDSEEDGEDYFIHVGSDDSVLEADQWPHIMKSERSAMIVLRLSRKSTSRDISLIDRSRSEQGKIEYGDLSSEHDSTDEDKTKALILRRPFNDVEPIYHSKYVGATSELLARQGYVVNDPYSLVSGSNPITSPKPVIFRRPERMVRPPFAQDGLHVARAITYESDNSGHISSGSYASVVDTKELAGKALSFAERVSSTSLVDDPVESAHSSRESHVPEHIDIEDDEKLSGSFELTPDVYDTRKYTEKDVQGPLSSSSRSINERDRPESEDEEATLGAIRTAISDREEGVGFGVKAKARFSQSQPNLHVATQDAPGLFKGDVKGEELVDSDLPLQDDANITQEEKRRLGVEDSPGDLRDLVGLQVRDLKGLISEEVAAALRQNTDQVNRDVQKQLEFELRNRLAKSGLLPNLIEAIINQGTDTAPGREERSPPNYTRVPTSQLDRATLLHFNLRFQHDILDPNFWIIFQHLTTEELLPMFDHTCDRRIEAHLERKRQEGSRAQTQERQEQNPPMDASPSEHIVGYMGVKNVVYQELEESEPSSTYAIRELPHKEYLRLHKLTDLSFPVNQCDFCKRARYYSSAEEAFEHLRRDHVSDTNQSSHLSRAQLSHWVMSSQLAGVEEQNELIVEYLSAMALRVETLRSKAIDIRNSVANERNEKPSEYLLPLSLVKAAEMILQMIDTCGYSVVELHKLNLDDTMPIISWKELKTHMDLLSYFGSAASTTLSSARKELLIMAHTGSHRGAVQNFRSTPEVTLLICLIHLWSRAVLHDLSVPDLYREHLSKMQYEASRRPSKLALRELYLLEEEFEMVASICAQQRRMIRDFYEIIGPSTYRIATKECFRADRDVVIPLMDQNLSSPASMGATSIGVRETQALFDRTKEVLRHNVEVSEESNSKAIRVFTLVTIVFLPLSFISSVFGMNTTDIRDMSSSQALFWVIAIPATTLIGGLSLMIAYHGTYMWAKVRAMGDAMWGSEKISRGRRAWKRKPKDVEKVDDGEIADTRPLGPGHLRRRKTVLNVVGSKKPRKFR